MTAKELYFAKNRNRINELAQKHILNQPLYVTGKPIAYTAREFGLDPKDIDKLASNENPFGPSPKGMEEARKALEEVNLYPDGGSYDLIGKIAEFRGVKREQIAVGNGSNELLDMIAQVFLGPGTEAVMGKHSFAVVDMPAPAYNYDLKAMRAAVNEKTRIVFLANPNNPTGSDLTAKEILDFADSLPETCVLVMDEAYTEFIEDTPELVPDFNSRIAAGKNIICCRTFSKIYGLAGLRVGYCITRPEIVDLINRVREPFNVNSIAQAAAIGAIDDLINRVREPFNVNSIAQAAAIGAIDDQEYVNKVRELNKKGLEQLKAGFKELGLPYVDSHSNFIAVSGFSNPMDAFKFLQAKGTIIRPQPAMGDVLRITVGTEAQNKKCLENIKAYLGK